MKIKNLTSKQSAFCDLVGAGSNLVDAYLKAYPISINWKRASVHNKAYELSNHVDIMSRIGELKKILQDEAEKEFAWNQLSSIKVLSSIALNENLREGPRVNAVKALNELLGLNSAKKMDLRSEDGTMSPASDEVQKAVLAAIKKKYERD